MTKKQNFRYWTLWRVACEKRGWDSRDSQLRHETHSQALGYDKSHSDMSNQEIDRIFKFYELLADPDNLGAVLFFQQPDREERKRLLWRIEQLASKPYIESICADRFGTIYFHDLDVVQLEQLRNTIRSRMRKKGGRSAEAAPATHGGQIEMAALG